MTELPDVFKGMRCPERPEILLTYRGWYIYGGPTFPEPKAFTVAELWAFLKSTGDPAAQNVLDETRKKLGDIRIAMKRRGIRYSEGLDLQRSLEKLRDQLREAQSLKAGRSDSE